MIQKGEQRIHELFVVPHAFRIFANFYSNGKTLGRSVLEGSKLLRYSGVLISCRNWSAAPENGIVNEAYCTVQQFKPVVSFVQASVLPSH